MSSVRGNLKEGRSKSWFRRTETGYKAQQLGKAAMNAEALYSSVPLLCKSGEIRGKSRGLPQEI